ncbi:DUF2239 family protein [Chromobacterium vaccinii]|uniref:DUF2239 family protein n=1 Tax=Chromobacterium vaccinii TaxID=1108595 RepID=A0ABV0FHA2_9NEIS
MNPATDFPPYAVFDGHRKIASGPLASVALAVKQAMENGSVEPVLIFDNTTGRTIDIDLRGTADEITARHAQTAVPDSTDGSGGKSEHSEPRGRGRPKLGVVAREVTLLPRHWDWLSAQPGGASVALRKLVEDARRVNAQRENRRVAQERAYHFISAIAGDLPGFEEASRALFADDHLRFSELTKKWPADVRDHAIALGFRDAP